MRLTSEPRRKTKRAAAARFAFHPDGATHQIDESGSDREAQTRSAISPRCRAVFLLEGTEDRLLLFARDADSGVADREADQRFIVMCRFAGELYPKYDFALRGELDGVAHQVEQDLTQPAGVADQGVRYIARDLRASSPFL